MSAANARFERGGRSGPAMNAIGGSASAERTATAPAAPSAGAVVEAEASAVVAVEGDVDTELAEHPRARAASATRRATEFEAKLSELRQFIAREKRGPSKSKHKAKDSSELQLSRWACEEIRRLRRLEELVGGYGIDRSVEWRYYFYECLRHRAKHGAWPTFKAGCSTKEKKMMEWIKRMRNAKKPTSTYSLSEEREQLLEGAGFVWNHRNEMWENKYNKLLNFMNTIAVHEGERRWPTTIWKQNRTPREEEEHSLAQWMSQQRTRYKRKADPRYANESGPRANIVLTPVQVAKLESIQFPWNMERKKRRKTSGSSSSSSSSSGSSVSL